MYQTIALSDFMQAFEILRPDNFSNNGLRALYNYLEGFEDETGKLIELDVIAFCCNFCEYADLKEFQDNYGKDYKSIENIQNETTVILMDDDSFIIQRF